MADLKMSLQDLLSEQSSFKAVSIGSTPRGAQAIKFTDESWSYKTHLANAKRDGLIEVKNNEIVPTAKAAVRVLAGNQRIFVDASKATSAVVVQW